MKQPSSKNMTQQWGVTKIRAQAVVAQAFIAQVFIAQSSRIFRAKAATALAHHKPVAGLGGLQERGMVLGRDCMCAQRSTRSVQGFQRLMSFKDCG